MARPQFNNLARWRRAAKAGGCTVRKTTSSKTNNYFTAVLGTEIVGFYNKGKVHDSGDLDLPAPQLARERKITGAGPVDVRESILRTVEAARRAIYGADGKPVNDSRKYVEIVDRERRLQAHGADKVGRDSLWLTMSDGTEWWIKVEKMR